MDLAYLAELPREEFITRRKKVFAQMQDNSAFIIFTETEKRRNNDCNYHFRPDSYFWYLTGFAEPESALLLIKRNGQCESTIFLRKKDREKEIWTGRRLGVEAAPEILKVDAAFEKDWLVFNHLKSQMHAFFNPEAPTSLPLNYMGHSVINPPHMVDGEICEYWLGPLGEQIFWIRPDDENLYWYAGGNPRTVKKQKTRAYFIFAERSLKNFELALLSFKDAFEGKPVKKIMCTRLEEENILPRIGFSNPDDIDQERIEFFLVIKFTGKMYEYYAIIYR